MGQCDLWPTSAMWLQYSQANASDIVDAITYGPIRVVVQYDVRVAINNNATYGNDIIFGYNGDDRLYGGNGDDMIYGGNGDDELIGGGHHDNLDGGNGNDIIVGDWAHTYRSRSADGQSWKWSMVTEDRVTIDDAIVLSYEEGSQWPEAQWWLRYDMYAAGNITETIGSTSSSEIYTAGLSILAGGNDIINGGDGDDVCIGGTGDDIINGEAGNDIIIGDHVITPSAMINSSMSTTSILPVIYHTMRIIPVPSTNDPLEASLNDVFGTAFFVDHYISSHELTLPLPTIHQVSSWQSSTLHHLVDLIPSLSDGCGTFKWRPNVVVYGNLVEHGHAQYGNDKLYGGHDNDIVVGDSLYAHAWTDSHNSFINEANQRVTSLSSSLSFRLSTLYNHYHQLYDIDCDATPTAFIACDTVSGSEGIDISVGDTLILPSIAPTFTSMTSAQLDTEIVGHHNLISNLEVITMMLEASISVSQYAVI
jgi:Ca2+-binding RTX toxin-like protein